jgi:hypothetical protein
MDATPQTELPGILPSAKRRFPGGKQKGQHSLISGI